MMINLSEAFQEEYREYLSKEFDKEVNEYNEQLQEAYVESQKSFNLIENYFNAFAEYESLKEAQAGDVLITDAHGKNPRVITAAERGLNDKKEEKKIKDDEEKTNKSEKKVSEVLYQAIGELLNNRNLNVDPTDEAIHYKPSEMYTEVTKVSQMKFPQNIIYFIKGLISWIKNLVLAFINKITNILRRLVGLKPNEEKFDLNIKNYMLKAKTIETSGFETIKSSNKKINVFKVPSEEVESLAEDFKIVSEDTKAPTVNEKDKSVYALQIDISDDMVNLKTLVSHFFNIFDASYGSNGEFLFKTDDLQLLLQVFSRSINSILSGEVPSYEFHGKATELVAIDKDKLRLNLEKTLTNTEKLKSIYVQIVNKINDLLKIITHKQLLAATDMGISFRFYSAATYTAMTDLIKMIDPRIKDAEKMEKDLQKMKKAYEEVTIKLGELQQSYSALAGITYESIIQKTIRNLFDSARIMTQTVTLRLTTLSLYIKALKDVREAIITANAVNRDSKKTLKKFIFD